MGRASTGVEIRENSIRIQFAFDGRLERHTLKHNGVPLKPTQANVRYAERLVQEIKDKIRLGTFRLADFFGGSSGGDLTVGDQLDAWLAAQRIEESTKDGYGSAIRFWKAISCHAKRSEPMGDKPLRALLTSHILTAIASRPDLNGKTVNNYVSVLRASLDLALTDGVLDRNPCDGVKRAKSQKEPPDPFTGEERDRVIGYFAEHYPAPVRNFVEFWFWSGLRTSEIFALSWRNVDLPGRHAVIAEAVVRGRYKDRTKTNTSRRLNLNSMAIDALRRQREHTYLAGAHVFQDPRYGAPWEDERAFRRSFWTPALKALGIRYRRPYNMRHTYATFLLMSGAKPGYCARQLGHSVEVFLTTYARWLDGERDDLEMRLIESAITDKRASA